VSEPPRLLLVEHDRQLLTMLDTLLTEEGYRVDTAADGQQGLHLGLTRSYDVVVLDRGLPAIEGLDLLTRLRLRGVITPTLVLSALANPGGPGRGAGRRHRGLPRQTVRPR
jgi:two-component system response regulator QseB